MLIYKKTIINRDPETNDLLNTTVKTIVRNFEKGYVKELDYGDLKSVTFSEDNFFACRFNEDLIISFDNNANLIWKKKLIKKE